MCYRFVRVKRQLSQNSRGLGRRSGPWPRYRVVLAAVLALSSLTARADAVAELDDAVARVEYAFYTMDTRSLKAAAGSIEQLAAPPELRGLQAYYVAFAHWKLAQLHQEEGAAGVEPSQAAKAGGLCVRYAETARKLDAHLAEAAALQAVCETFEPGLTGVRASCARSKLLRGAREKAPANPRIQLIEALCVAEQERASDAYLARLRTVVQAFETASASAAPGPDWGLAEALVALTQCYLQRGEQTSARDAVERALVIAPDYRKAQALLTKVSARPR